MDRAGALLSYLWLITYLVMLNVLVGAASLLIFWAYDFIAHKTCLPAALAIAAAAAGY